MLSRFHEALCVAGHCSVSPNLCIPEEPLWLAAGTRGRAGCGDAARAARAGGAARGAPRAGAAPPGPRRSGKQALYQWVWALGCYALWLSFRRCKRRASHKLCQATHPIWRPIVSERAPTLNNLIIFDRVCAPQKRAPSDRRRKAIVFVPSTASPTSQNLIRELGMHKCIHMNATDQEPPGNRTPALPEPEPLETYHSKA